MEEQIKKLLANSGLDDWQEQILKMRFGIGWDYPKTLEEVGQCFNLTRERIRQIEGKALAKLQVSGAYEAFTDYLKNRKRMMKNKPVLTRKMIHDVVEKTKRAEYEKYYNPDRRCQYPFIPHSLGYCWGYAGWVDNKGSEKELIKHCKHCEFWRGK